MRDKWTEIILLFSLIMTIVFKIVTDQLKLLINPVYFIFVYISIIFLLILMVVCLRTKSATKSDKKDIQEVGRGYNTHYILLLTMIILINSISYNDFQDRITEIKGIPITDVPGPTTTDRTPSFSSHIVLDDNNYYEMLVAIYSNPELYEGSTIELKGYAADLEGLSSDQFILSRLVMLCCAADATAAGLVCDGSEINAEYINNSWYEIEGVIEVHDITLNDEVYKTPVIKISESNNIEAPDTPYIYSDLL